MQNLFEHLGNPVLMAVLGLLSHGLKKIMRVRKSGRAVTPWGYIGAYPYQTLTAIIGMVAGVSALHELGQLTGLTAFGVGYMCNSVADLLGNKNKKAE